MDAAIDRQTIHSFIDQADEKVLDIIRALMRSLNNEETDNIKVPKEILNTLNKRISETDSKTLVKSETVHDEARKLCMR